MLARRSFNEGGGRGFKSLHWLSCRNNNELTLEGKLVVIILLIL